MLVSRDWAVLLSHLHREEWAICVFVAGMVLLPSLDPQFDFLTGTGVGAPAAADTADTADCVSREIVHFLCDS